MEDNNNEYIPLYNKVEVKIDKDGVSANTINRMIRRLAYDDHDIDRYTVIKNKVRFYLEIKVAKEVITTLENDLNKMVKDGEE